MCRTYFGAEDIGAEPTSSPILGLGSILGVYGKMDDHFRIKMLFITEIISIKWTVREECMIMKSDVDHMMIGWSRDGWYDSD